MLPPRDLVFGFFESEDPFPIDFDKAWQWIGYREKGKAKRALLVAGFVERVDFLPILAKSSGGRPSELIYLTIDCFKMFCMMAGTAKGREVRLYFLECEKELKLRIEQEAQRNKQRVVRAIVSEEHITWKKRFEDVFFEEAYRVTGWQPPETGHPPCMAQFINETIYDYFPDGTRDRLNTVNPRVGGRRKRKQHQHLTPTLGAPLLESQKTAVIAVMRLSPANNRQKFRQNMNTALGTVIQIELPFMNEDQAS
jgi:phage anti-repressor protein